MDPTKLYKFVLRVMGVFGLSLTYQDNWKGTLKKYFASYNILSLCISWTFFHMYNLIFENLSIEEFTENIACVVSESEAIIKAAVFLAYREKFSYMLWKMTTLLRSGNSLNDESFRKISKIGRILAIVYYTSSIMASSNFDLKALFGTLTTRRMFPFQGK